jgi:MoaA/NifB/PqqE/SkfB family radical SAM enzyme
MIGVSIDSFDADTNLRIGRGHLKFKKVLDMRNEAKRMGVMFKVNTVVNQQNVREDFNAHMQLLDVDRWKALQVLKVERENGNSFDALTHSQYLTPSSVHSWTDTVRTKRSLPSQMQSCAHLT